MQAEKRYASRVVVSIFRWLLVLPKSLTIFTAEEEAKYPCEISADIEAKTIPNGHAQMNGHALNGFLPNISSHLAEKVFLC